jgi:hypothetical protein
MTLPTDSSVQPVSVCCHPFNPQLWRCRQRQDFRLHPSCFHLRTSRFTLSRRQRTSWQLEGPSESQQSGSGTAGVAVGMRAPPSRHLNDREFLDSLTSLCFIVMLDPCSSMLWPTRAADRASTRGDPPTTSLMSMDLGLHSRGLHRAPGADCSAPTALTTASLPIVVSPASGSEAFSSHSLKLIARDGNCSYRTYTAVTSQSQSQAVSQLCLQSVAHRSCHSQAHHSTARLCLRQVAQLSSCSGRCSCVLHHLRLASASKSGQ